MKRALLLLSVLIVVAVGAFYVGTQLQPGTEQAVRPGATGPTPTVSTPGAPVKPGKTPKNPFGVFFNVMAFDIQDRVRFAQEVGVKYFRSWPALLPTWNGQCSECRFIQEAGLKQVLTIRNATDFAQPSGPVTDIDAFKQTVGEILDAYQPALLVVENEEDNTRFYTGTPEDYIFELQAACEVAHQRKIKCTNGGLVNNGVTWLTYQHLVDIGRSDEAAAFAGRTFAPGQQQTLSSPAGTEMARQFADRELSFAGNYEAAGADYVNIHWYVADAQGFAEAVKAFGEITGLPAISNEIGQTRQSAGDPGLVTALLEQVVTLKLPIAVWFGSDAGSATGLLNPDGSLRSNGEAFSSFVHSHSS